MQSRIRYGLLISLIVISLFVMWFSNSHAESINYIYDDLGRLYQVFDPQVYDRMGVLTFDVGEFLRMLDMAVVFRTLLPPEEQRILHELLKNEETSEEQFYWGRLLGCLTREAKDMLNAWRIRQWPKARVDLLYELVEYVGFYQSY